MIPFSLALKSAPVAGAAAAWFIPGTDAAAWIEELAEWGLPMGALRLYLTPVRGSKATGGVLVLPPAGHVPRATARAQGYRFVGDRLLIPTGSELDPPVHPPELVRKLAGPLYWLHPTIGLVMFREDEVLGVRELLEFDPGTPRAWNRAQSGITRPPRLLSVEPDHEPSVEAVLEEAREDIGSEMPGELPPDPEEEPPPQSGMQQAKKKALEAIDWLTGQAPQTSKEPTWVDRVQDWARKKLAGLDPSLRQERNRELDKLLKMLERDPDRGLKYAIPLKGQASRGIAEPSARLGPHTTDFDLSRLGGGGAADSWDAPWEIKQKLMEAYRRAALHALQIGRHRRAAYIYAELLGDFDSAANALRAGRHFREAAVLYREKLRKPQDAARCLEEGGLIAEAIPLYEQLGNYMKAGELYEQLERPEDATAAYRKAAEALIASGDTLRAAQVIETRVKAPDEALDLLDRGWPGGSQGALCLRESFGLLARLGRHDAAARRAERLRVEPVPEGKLVVLVSTLAQVSRTYPDARVRASTADLTRVLAGQALDLANEADASALALAVAELVPTDPYLSRDAHRFVERRRKRAAGPALRPASRTPEMTRREQLLSPGQYTWKGAVACGEHFYALGLHRSMKPTLVRGTWDGRSQHVTWSEGVAAIPKLVLEPPQGTVASALIWLPGGAVLGPRVLASNDRLPLAVEAGTPSWLPEESIGLTREDNDTAWVLRREGNTELMLAGYSPKGTLLGTVALESGPQTARVNLLGKQQGARPAPAVPVPMAARGGHVFVALGNRLLHVFNQARCRPTELLMDARDLVLSPPFAPAGLAVVATYSTGASVFWPGPDGDLAAPQHIADGRPTPLACFTRSGHMILLSREEGLVLEGPPGRMLVIATFPVAGDPPVALMPADKKNEFAVLSSDGSLRVFKIPLA